MSDHLGRVLGGRYRLVAPIGRGASAQVFLADDVRLERRVAVKVLHEALADDQEFLRRFRAEAQAAAALNHPHVMAVYDWGHDDGEVPWIVTEYLGGGSLRALLDRGIRLTPSQALVVGLQAARGLDYAHRRGFVHRDVKPANLLFDDEARLRIADFGLARALAEAAWTEPQGAVVGTARYASPEQAQGLSLTGRADVYSLALVVVEAVTGEVPFATDTTLGTLMARIGKPFPRPAELGPLADVVAAAGEPDPDDRLDARGFAAALSSVAPSLPRPSPLPLSGAVEYDVDAADRDPTTLAGGPGAAGGAAIVGAAGAVDLDGPGGDDGPVEPGVLGADDGADDPTVFVTDDGADDPTVFDGDDGADDPTVFVADAGAETDATAASDATVGLDTTSVAGAAPEASPGWIVPAPEPAAVPYDAEEEGVWDPRSPTGRPRRRWPRILFWTLVAAALVAAIGLLVARLVVDDEPRTAIVPPVAGLSEEAATRSLTQLGWEVEPERVREDGTDAGQVLRTRPDEGTELEEGETIVLVVSDGPPLVDVPTIARGTPRDDAERALGEVGLRTAFDERHDEEVADGQVIEVLGDPPARVEKGTTINLAVSIGPEPRTIPEDLVGADEAAVVGLLRELGLEPDVQRDYSDDVAAGLVISTSPAAGEQAERGATVAVVVSLGPDLVTVPDVSAAGSLDGAVDLLEEAGLVAGSFQGPAGGVPVGTSPGAGEEVRRGSEVDIILAADD